MKIPNLQVKPIRKEAEKYYFLSDFAASLNEMEDGVAPTDSRLRPDQRLMEEAMWDEANEEKVCENMIDLFHTILFL